MNKIKQVLSFVGDSHAPWLAARALTKSLVLTPALIYHEIMHLLVVAYGTICGVITDFEILRLDFLKVTKCVKEEDVEFQTLTSQLTIQYRSSFAWGRAVGLAPLIGYFLLIIYCIVFFHPLILIYCVYAAPTFMLSDVDIESLESLDYNSKRLRLIKRFKKFLTT
jgi:hypothetical protein